MNVTLTPKIPAKDGRYIMRYHLCGSLHIVTLMTKKDGSRVLIPSNNIKLKKIEVEINEAHANIFKDAWFSETPIIETHTMDNWTNSDWFEQWLKLARHQ